MGSAVLHPTINRHVLKDLCARVDAYTYDKASMLSDLSKLASAFLDLHRWVQSRQVRGTGVRAPARSCVRARDFKTLEVAARDLTSTWAQLRKEHQRGAAAEERVSTDQCLKICWVSEDQTSEHKL